MSVEEDPETSFHLQCRQPFGSGILPACRTMSKRCRIRAQLLFRLLPPSRLKVPVSVTKGDHEYQ